MNIEEEMRNIWDIPESSKVYLPTHFSNTDLKVFSQLIKEIPEEDWTEFWEED